MMKYPSDKVKAVFENYPPQVKSQMLSLRAMVYAVAEELGLEDLEETLKWGEPSYLTKKGSTLRMDWKAKKPLQYALYFKCTSQLIVTIKEIYGDFFNYETTRAIVFGLDDIVPAEQLKVCIRLALTYHKVKHLPRLGVE